jgi:hypothetical protein
MLGVVRRLVKATILVALSLLAVSEGAFAYSFGPAIQQTGLEAVVFDPATSLCSPAFTTDQPVHAFRSNPPSTYVALTLPQTQDVNRLAYGPNMDDLTEDCTNVLDHNGAAHGGATNDDNSSYHWGEHIGATYRLPNSDTVVALIHNEYHGDAHHGDAQPVKCSTSDPGHGLSYCWEGAITQAKSDSNGLFQHPWGAGPPAHRVANIPHKYTDYNTSVANEWGANGYRGPTNIVKDPNSSYYYSIFNAQQFPKNKFDPNDPTLTPLEREKANAQAQQGFGSCVMRTSNLDDPSSWRAWDGSGFNVQFVNPYTYQFTATDTPAQHVCKPLPQIGNLVPRSLTYNTYFQKFMLVGNNAGDFLFSLSNDVVNWSSPTLLLDAPTQAEACQAGDASVGMPSVIDPGDGTANFERPDDTVYLFFVKTRWANQTCLPVSRQLVRVAIRFRVAPRTATGMYWACPGGTDTGSMGQFAGGTAYIPPDSYFTPSADRFYDSFQASYLARLATTAGSNAMGIFNKQGEPPQCFSDEDARPSFSVGPGGEIMYGGAFFFPKVGFWDKMDQASNPSVTLLRFGTTQQASRWAGSLSIDKDGRLKLTTNNGSTEQTIMAGIQHPDPAKRIRRAPNNEPDTCWHRFDIVQQFGTGGDRYTLVYIDGVLYGYTPTPATVNASLPDDIIGAGIVGKQNVSNLRLYVDQFWMGGTSRPAYVQKCE